MPIKNLFRYWTYQIFSPDIVLKEKYESFKELLEYDKTAHEFMATLEDMYYSQKKYDFQAVVTTYDKMACSVSGMVDTLLKMCPTRYWELKEYFKKFDSYNRYMLVRPRPNTAPPFTIEFAKASLLNEKIAGKKAYVLSTINQKLHLPTPNGFVITTQAYNYFLFANKLQDPINRILAVLDINDSALLKKTACNIESMIIESQIPVDLKRAILNTADNFKRTNKKNVLLALRSSAVKEDGDTSFAGQYRTVLNVDKRDILHEYKRVIASKYSAKALYYRISHGILDDETPMAVLVLEMIDAASSGVIYTKNLSFQGDDNLTIHAVYGPGEQLVDGNVSPTIIQILQKKSDASAVVKKIPLNSKKKSPLDEPSIATLARWGNILEEHFKAPQDIEWCQRSSDKAGKPGNLFILQSRPLGNHKAPRIATDKKKGDNQQTIKNRRLCIAEESICTGIGSGPVFRLSHYSEAGHIPKGAVVVTRHAPPQLILGIHHMAAIIIENGSRASHFSSIAREYGIPSIVDIRSGVETLSQGKVVTVDADNCIVYEGLIESVNKMTSQKSGPVVDLYKDSSFMTKLRYVINFSVKLKFTDPQSETFVPQSCRSIHDIIRFTHETAMKEMFLSGNRKGSRKKGARKLIFDIPMLFYVLDVGKGIKHTQEKVLRPDHITSLPMKAVMKGLLNPGICWSETTHFDWEEYDKIVMNGGIISADSPWFGSFAIVSNEYLNCNFRFGYHFVILDSLCTPDTKNNYILFRFSGGGGSPAGRSLRAGFIKGVLEHFNFSVTLTSDLVDARLKLAPINEMLETLDIIGRLLGTTKLMDMYLKEHFDLEFLIEQFLNGWYDFRPDLDHR